MNTFFYEELVKISPDYEKIKRIFKRNKVKICLFLPKCIAISIDS